MFEEIAPPKPRRLAKAKTPFPTGLCRHNQPLDANCVDCMVDELVQRAASAKRLQRQARQLTRTMARQERAIELSRSMLESIMYRLQSYTGR